MDVTGALQYVQFGGLPSNAAGPGPDSTGAAYFAHAGRSDSRQVYLRYLSLRLKNLGRGLNVELGAWHSPGPFERSTHDIPSPPHARGHAGAESVQLAYVHRSSALPVISVDRRTRWAPRRSVPTRSI